MGNTKTWQDPDTMNGDVQGQAEGVYLIDPTTKLAYAASGGAITNDGTFAKEAGGNLAAIKTDLDTLVINTADLLADGDQLATIATNTTGVATAANQTTANTSLSGIKTDLDEIALDTDNLASILTQDTTTATNTTTLAGVVSGGKAAVKATTAGDFVDGSDATQGTTTQTKATDGSSTSWSVIQLLKGIFDKLLGSIAVTGTFWQATQPVSGTVTANAGTGFNANGQTTMSASAPVTMASDQTPKTTATATRTNVAGAASDTSLLASNTGRKGAIFFNDSTAILYLAYGSGAASTSSYSVQIQANGYFELPPEPIFTGAIRGIWSVANGNVRITELS